MLHAKCHHASRRQRCFVNSFACAASINSIRRHPPAACRVAEEAFARGSCMLLPAAAAVDRAGPAAVQEVAEPFERLHSTGRGKARRLEYLTNLREQGIGNYNN